MADEDLVNLLGVDEGTEGDSQARTPRKQNSYSNEFKLKVVKHAEAVSDNDAAKTFGVTRSRVFDWRKIKEKLKLQRYLFFIYLF
jgi:transposase-like protein